MPAYCAAPSGSVKLSRQVASTWPLSFMLIRIRLDKWNSKHVCCLKLFMLQMVCISSGRASSPLDWWRLFWVSLK